MGWNHQLDKTPNHKHMSSRNHPQLTVDGRNLALWIMEDDPGNGKTLWLFRVYRGWNTSNYVVVLVNHYKYDKDPYYPTSMMESTRVFFCGSPGLRSVSEQPGWQAFLIKWRANFRNKVSRSVLLVNSKGIEMNPSPNKKNASKKVRFRKICTDEEVPWTTWTIPSLWTTIQLWVELIETNRSFALMFWDQAMDTAPYGCGLCKGKHPPAKWPDPPEV